MGTIIKLKPHLRDRDLKNIARPVHPDDSNAVVLLFTGVRVQYDNGLTGKPKNLSKLKAT